MFEVLTQDGAARRGELTLPHGANISSCHKNFLEHVLEHVDNISEYIQLFEKLLTPNGVIIVSGPTENIFYKKIWLWGFLCWELIPKNYSSYKRIIR